MPDKVLMPMPNNSSNQNNSNSQPLPPSMRHKFETHFGQDLSAVRIHQGHQATLVGAEAYTQGNDIFFAPNKYHPFTKSGSELLGHELSHIVQQGAGENSDVPKGMVKVDNAQNSND